MTAPLLFDPEIEGLLQEIAADPRSHLLKVDRPTALSIALDRDPRISIAKAGLTSAERHLLQVHRVEVAWLLRQACLSAFVREDSYSMWINPELASLPGYELLGNTELNDRLSCEGLSPKEGVATLSAMALSIHPTDNARVYSAMSHLIDGQLMIGTRVLTQCLAGPMGLQDRSAALIALAFSQSERLMYDESVATLRQAVGCPTTDQEAGLNWFFNACMARDPRQMLAASAQLANCNRCVGELQRFSHLLIKQRSLGPFRPPRDIPQPRGLSFEAQEVLHALA